MSIAQEERCVNTFFMGKFQAAKPGSKVTVSQFLSGIEENKKPYYNKYINLDSQYIVFAGEWR